MCMLQFIASEHLPHSLVSAQVNDVHVLFFQCVSQADVSLQLLPLQRLTKLSECREFNLPSGLSLLLLLI